MQRRSIKTGILDFHLDKLFHLLGVYTWRNVLGVVALDLVDDTVHAVRVLPHGKDKEGFLDLDTNIFNGLNRPGGKARGRKDSNGSTCGVEGKWKGIRPHPHEA